MSVEREQEILVWTNEGYEGRFLRWEVNAWQAFEHRNYRHWFSPPQPPTASDLTALRKAFDVPVEAISDNDLSVTSPDKLAEIAKTPPR